MVPFVLVVVFTDGLNDFGQFLGRKFVESVEDGVSQPLPVADDMVPFLFQGSFLDHRFVVIPIRLISVDSKLCQSLLLLICVILAIVAFLVMNSFVYFLKLYLSLSFDLRLSILGVVIELLFFFLDGIKYVDSAARFQGRILFPLGFGLNSISPVANGAANFFFLEEKLF